MKISTAIALLAGAAAQVALAAPRNEARTVWAPPILYPHSGTVWNSGERHNVSWSTANQPSQITSVNNGIISLRFGNIESPVILAHHFDVRLGRIEVTVPDVFTGNDFSLVFFGDSGDISEQFTINGPESW